MAINKLINRYNGIKSFLLKKNTNVGNPVECIIEITNSCNLTCIMCPRRHMKRTIGFMDFDLFKKIIDEIKGYIELVYISGGLGEPFLHPRLFDMVEYCRKNNVRVGISTNATLLNEKQIRDLIERGPDILLLSLDAVSKEIHEKIRVGSKFERTMSNVESLLKAKKTNSRPYIIAQMVYMETNKAESDLFIDKWKTYPGINDVRMKKFLDLGHYLNESAEGSDSPHCQQLTQQPPCILPWRQISISWDGSFALCCRDLDFQYPIGNVRDTEIKKLWNSKKMEGYRSLIANHTQSKIKLCSTCKTIRTNPVTHIGMIFIDAYRIRKLLPYLEKLYIKTGLKIADY